MRHLKIAKVSDVDQNTQAKFYMDHANDIFTYKFTKTGEPVKGVIQYNHETDTLEFKYRGRDGKIYTKKNLSVEDFTKLRTGETEPRLRFKDSKIKISKEEYERLRDYEDPNKAANFQRHLSIISDMIDERRNALEKTEDDLLTAHDELEAERQKLVDLKADLDNISPSQPKYKKFVNSTIKQIGVYEKWITMSENNINELSQHRDNLRQELNILKVFLKTQNC